MIRTYLKLHTLVFLRESTAEPGDGTTIVAFDDDDTPRYWWVFNPVVDGCEYYPPAPQHRIVDPLSIQSGQRSRDYAGVTHLHKRVRLTKPPTKLLAALESARQKHKPRVAKRRWRPIVWIRCRSRVRRLRLWLRSNAGGDYEQATK